MIDFSDSIRPRILVVDDSADNLLAYRNTLSGEYDVVMVSSGREALRYLMEQEFALILLDVVMPDLDGFETAELIRARKKTSAVPIIFVSAYPPDDIQTFEGYSVGAADFISTPINPEILRAKVSAFLNLYKYNRAKEELLRRELLLEIERKESDRRLADARRKTELLNQQREYESRTAELNRQKFKELEQFAYVASHDLKAPLRTISNYLELFYSKYRGQIDMEADQYIQFVVAGAKKLNHLIDDLLNYSRLGSGVQKWEECDVRDTLEEVMLSLHSQIVESKAEITFDDLPKVQSDKTLLAQLFQNLIGNAISYRRKDLAPKIHISCLNNPAVGRLFKVTDNGVGFEMKFSDQIFEMFRSLNKHEHGTGIGLAICKKIVQRHGGTIWAESKVGVGSTFSFTIPNVLNERDTLKGMRILLVDDAPDIRVVSSRLLSTTGAQYDCVEDAFAAIEKVKAQSYDVILLDILMPRMDGYEAKEKLRALGCKSPIVAFSTIEKRETFAEKGFADYLPKDALGETLLPFLQKIRAKSIQAAMN